MKKQVINTVANPFTQTIQCQSTKIMFYKINLIPKAAVHANKRGGGVNLLMNLLQYLSKKNVYH